MDTFWRHPRRGFPDSSRGWTRWPLKGTPNLVILIDIQQHSASEQEALLSSPEHSSQKDSKWSAAPTPEVLVQAITHLSQPEHTCPPL